MDTMSKWKYKLQQLMAGRYGADDLYKALFGGYALLLVLNIFVRSPFLSLLMWGLLILMLFRSFSRNYAKRARENQQFLRLWNPLCRKWNLSQRKVRERKTARFRTCPHCKTVLRLPVKRGSHTATCPHCKKDVSVRILF